MSLLLNAPLKYEPLKQNRFLLKFPTDIGIQTWKVKSVDAPSFEITTNEMKFINTSTYVNGSYKWNPQNVVIRDFIAPSSSQGLIEWLRLHAESVSGRMGYNVGSAKTLNFERLDPTGTTVSNFTMVNCILTGTVNWGSYSYDSDEVAEISFTLQPQYCILEY